MCYQPWSCSYFEVNTKVKEQDNSKIWLVAKVFINHDLSGYNVGFELGFTLNLTYVGGTLLQVRQNSYDSNILTVLRTRYID